jgi:hypothetical protein
MNKYIKILLGFTICVFLGYGCEKENIKQPKTNTNTNTNANVEISFSKDIVPIFNAKCISCHYTGGTVPNLSKDPYNNIISGGFVDINSPSSSKLYVIITTTSMGGTNSSEKNEILTWIKQGALDN